MNSINESLANDENHLQASEQLSEKLQFGFRKQLPMQRQAESAECGLACLSMVANYYGFKTNISDLREKFSLSLKGATLNQLSEIAIKLKMAPRALRLEIDEISQLELPCILHWDLKHFVVLKKLTKSGVLIHDPARGIQLCNMEELSKRFTGIALELKPAPGFQRKVPSPKIGLRKLLGHVVGLKRAMTQIIILALVLELISLLAPLFNQWVIDHAILTGDKNLVIVLAIGFAILKATSIVIETFRSWAVMMLSTSLNVQWLSNLFIHLLKLPVSYFEKRHMGDVVSRFNSIHTIQNTITTSFVSVILDGIMATGTLAMMLIYSWKLATVALVAMILYAILRSSFYASLMAASENEVVYDAEQQSIFMETIRGFQSLKLFSKESERVSRWVNVVVNQKNASLRTQRLTIIFQSGNGLLFGLENIIVIAIGAFSVIENSFSVGMLIAFLSYKMQFSTRISNLIDKYFELRMLELQAARLADIALAEPELEDNLKSRGSATFTASIEVKSLAFAYGVGEKPVFTNLNFTIKEGESVAIVGASGCGKTTLMKILLGIYKPSYGEVLIGGIPLSQFGISNFRREIGTVMQEDSLFAGTVAENISFFDDASDQKWVEECAKMAAIHLDILAMPLGYFTAVGDMGSALSSGQKQRLLLARALYGKPKILFLDEATSNLDSGSEAIVTEAVNALSLTKVIIAHRRETIESADRTIFLGNKNMSKIK